MPRPSLPDLLQGPFHFLLGRRDLAEGLRRAERDFPMPQQIALEDDRDDPLYGFPILLSEASRSLRHALQGYVEAEESAQLALLKRESFDRRAYAGAWDRYRDLLRRAVENAVVSSYGRSYPEIFWLYHSVPISRLLKETPRRILRRDAPAGREYGDRIRYLVLDRLLDKVRGVTGRAVERLVAATDEAREDLFPAVLERMAANILILTEDYIGPDLAELQAYFSGHLGIDGREFRSRWAALGRWHAVELARSSELQETVRCLLGPEAPTDPQRLLHRPGYVSFLATRPTYDPAALLPPEWVEIWERLLGRLKEFEVLFALRSLVLPVRRKGDRFVCQDPALRGTRTGVERPELSIEPSARVLDFMTPGVVDPQVRRFGLIYDISDFSEILGRMRRSPRAVEEAAFRMVFNFQRRVNRLASRHRLRLEKHLGDGAFFSGRNPQALLVMAVLLQRAYTDVVSQGFPFDRGLRIALNFAQYRLIPMQDDRYEFFGHGIVELSRLVTGKATREVDEMKNHLLALGYSAAAVDRFFAPLTRRNLDVVDKEEEARPFHAYLNGSGALINEGIVATREFIVELDRRLEEQPLTVVTDGPRRYLVLDLEDAGVGLGVGLRKLGTTLLKGLDRLAVFEAVDAESCRGSSEPGRVERLAPALERLFVEHVAQLS